MNFAGVVLLCAVALFSTAGFALRPADIDWTGKKDEIVIEGRVFRGALTDRQNWKGVFCNGTFGVGGTAKGTVEKIDFEPKEEGVVGIYANLTSVEAVVRGDYRSEMSLCTRIGINQNISIERAEMWADVIFTDKGEGQEPDLKVRIHKTQLHRLEILELHPPFLGVLVTDFANQMLESIWASELGRWVEEKVEKALGGKLPFPNS